jgi:hypothetical protein
MKRTRIAILATLLACAFFPAPRARAYDPNAVAAVNEMARIYTAFCLEKFPDRDAMESLAKDLDFKGMNYGELKRYENNALGFGWYISARNNLYVVTLEDPPHEACAVRHMTPEGIPSADAYTEAVKNFAAAKKGNLFKALTNKQKTSDGSDVSTFSNFMEDTGGRQTDMFMLVLTDYHGKVPEEWKADAQKETGVEVRMEHRLISQEQPENR